MNISLKNRVCGGTPTPPHQRIQRMEVPQEAKGLATPVFPWPRVGRVGGATAVGLLLLVGLPSNAMAMHISEGILPAPWAGGWSVLALLFVAWSVRDLRMRSERTPFFKPMVGLVGAAVFIVSCMPVPVPTAGTCSHPCGTGMAAILIGPGPTIVVTSIALLLQALFLAHGGLTTWGANIMSMGVMGGFTGYVVFHLARKLGAPLVVAAFLAGLLSDWATYATTSIELATALHGSRPVMPMFLAIFAGFMPTQIPLGIGEGVLTAGVCAFIRSRRPALMGMLASARGGEA